MMEDREKQLVIAEALHLKIQDVKAMDGSDRSKILGRIGRMCSDEIEKLSLKKDKNLDPRFGLTQFLVEANSYEQMALWQAWHQERDEEWEEDNTGLGISVGEIGDLPVFISVQWADINGMKVLFWYPTSRAVDHQIIEEWFDRNCSPVYGSRRARTDASNLQHAVSESKSRAKKRLNEITRQSGMGCHG